MTRPLPTYARPPRDEMGDRLARRLYFRRYPFYRKYPYLGPVSLFQVEHRGAFSPQDGFFYNRVPKAANTSIARLLAENSSYTRPGARAGDKRRFLRPQLMSDTDVAQVSAPETFRFTVVRNPYTRVLSAYRSKILLIDDAMRLRRFAKYLGSDGKTPPDFTTFCRFLDNGGVWRDAHWAPQTDLMLLPPEMYDFVGKVETIDADLAHVATQIWGEGAVKPTPRLGHDTKSGDVLAHAYTDEAQAIVARLYAEDFARFGYSKDLP